MTTLDHDNETPPAITLDEAVAQAVFNQQRAETEAAAAAQTARRQAEQEAIERFRLPFDEQTLAVLPTLNFRFEGDNNPIAWFEYEGLTVEIYEYTRHTHCKTWVYSAHRQGVAVLTRTENVYPNSSWVGHQTSEQRGQGFLLWLHEAVNTPTPEAETRETGTYEDFRANRKRRERFVREAMQGTLMGLTYAGVEAGACLQTALFAIETAEQVLALMNTTPLQRQVLKVLSLEQFTNWLGSKPAGKTVGSLVDYGDHPVCNYIQQACGVSLDFSSLALHDKDGVCVLGNDGTAPVPHELPLDFVGKWLPALLNWKEADPETQADYPTFTALEVLTFLEPFQR